MGRTIRVRGDYLLREVYSANSGSIYIDAIGLQEIPTLLREFRNYEKFFVHMVALEFVPNQPVTVGGTMSMAPDYDPIDPFPPTVAAMSQSQGFKSGPITSGLIVKMPNFKLPDGGWMRPSLFTGPNNNDRLVSYGHINYTASSSLNDDVDLGRLVLHWDISFSVLQPPNFDTILDYPGVSWGILSVKDTSGTASAQNITGSLSSDEFDLYNAAHAALQVMTAGSVFSGIIKAVDAALTLTSRGGKSVNPGTRIFFKPNDVLLTSATGTVSPQIADTANLGGISLSRTFDRLSDLLFTRSGNGFVDVTNIKQIN